jgi:hypothetical protein
MTMLGRTGSLVGAAIMLGALVGVAVPQASTSLSQDDKALLQGIITALGQLTGGGVLKVAPVDSTQAELNYIPPDDSTVTSIAYSASPVLCMASNALRQGGRFYNNSNQDVLLLEDEGAPTSTNFTLKIAPGGLYILPMNTNGVYTDNVNCLWAAPAAVGGTLLVTEIIS